MNFILYFQK